MLKAKTAIVTGSTSGIGLGIAKALAAEGCNSQESDTFVSLGRLPEAGQVSSQMEGDSQHLSLEVDASSQTAGSQLSSEMSDHSADPPLEGNFPAVNIVSSREPARPPAGPGAAGARL